MKNLIHTCAVGETLYMCIPLRLKQVKLLFISSHLNAPSIIIIKLPHSSSANIYAILDLSFKLLLSTILFKLRPLLSLWLKMLYGAEQFNKKCSQKKRKNYVNDLIHNEQLLCCKQMLALKKRFKA